jgi:hypothetical protein
LAEQEVSTLCASVRFRLSAPNIHAKDGTFTRYDPTLAGLFIPWYDQLCEVQEILTFKQALLTAFTLT